MNDLKKLTITAHVLVKNEENYIWYAVNSVLPYVDKMLIFDTGSTDKTVEIIKGILAKDKDKKIIFEEKGEVDKQSHSDLRNEMIKRTTTDWILLLDGDEVWDKKQIQNITKYELPFLPKFKVLGLVSFQLYSYNTNFYSELGHYGFSWGMHNQIAMRLMRNTVPQILFRGEYGKESLYMGNKIINNLQSNYFCSTSFYHHYSKLPRSSNDKFVFERSKKSLGKYLGPLRKFFLKKVRNTPKIFNETK